MYQARFFYQNIKAQQIFGDSFKNFELDKIAVRTN